MSNSNRTNLNVVLVSDPAAVAQWVVHVRQAADTQKEALGFLRESVYTEAAEQGKLIVAMAQEEDSETYAGHLLYGGVFPHARIFQVYVAPRFRLKGIGRRLVEAVVSKMEDHQFLSVISKVADDLEANKFWEEMRFEAVRTRPGGKTTKRTINIRVRELDTPRLFAQVRSIRQDIVDLGLLSRFSNLSPKYLIDLNVMYDLVKKRPKAEEAGRLINAGFDNRVRLAVTEEFSNELRRTSNPGVPDPILELALKLPTVPMPPPEWAAEATERLSGLIFPERASRGTLTDRDRSDLIHLATAIYHRVAGFITGEKAILRAREQLNAIFPMDIVGAGEFVEAIEMGESQQSHLCAISDGASIRVVDVSQENLSLVADFLSRMEIPRSLLPEATLPEAGSGYRRVLVSCDGLVIGFALWNSATLVQPTVRAFLCADEGNLTSELAIDHLLNTLSRESIQGVPIQISLQLLPGQVATRRIAMGHGFRPPANEPGNSTNLQKVCVGRFVTASSWPQFSRQVKKASGIELPSVSPSFELSARGIAIVTPAGQNLVVTVQDLEGLLSPVLLALDGRSCAVIPIRRSYAFDLIGGSNQASLLPSRETVLLRERVYFSDPRNARVLGEGTAVLFYESAHDGGRASIVAGARIVRSECMSKGAVLPSLYRHAVLSQEDVGKMNRAPSVLATTFDNLLVLQRPVSIERLRQLGCVDAANFVTSCRITSEQFCRIVEEGSYLWPSVKTS